MLVNHVAAVNAGTPDCCQFARRTDALPEKYRYFSGFCFPAASAGVNKTLTRQRGSFILKSSFTQR